MDCIVYEIAKSRTRLSDFHSLTHSLEATVDFGLWPGKGYEQGLGNQTGRSGSSCGQARESAAASSGLGWPLLSPRRQRAPPQAAPQPRAVHSSSE